MIKLIFTFVALVNCQEEPIPTINDGNFLNPETMSNRCKTKCIDLGKNYCPFLNNAGGECFDDDEEPDRASNTTKCSNDLGSVGQSSPPPKWFKYMTCPNEPACGTKDLYPWMPDRKQKKWVYNDTTSVITFHSSDEAITWDAARLACQVIGGDLASIHSAEEDAYAWSISKSEPAFFGLNDVANDGTWLWSDGSPLNYTNWNNTIGNSTNPTRHSGDFGP